MKKYILECEFKRNNLSEVISACNISTINKYSPFRNSLPQFYFYDKKEIKSGRYNFIIGEYIFDHCLVSTYSKENN